MKERYKSEHNDFQLDNFIDVVEGMMPAVIEIKINSYQEVDELSLSYLDINHDPDPEWTPIALSDLPMHKDYEDPDDPNNHFYVLQLPFLGTYLFSCGPSTSDDYVIDKVGYYTLEM